MRHICTSIVATLALVGTSLGETIHVPSDYATIHEAMTAAENGDVILIAPGVYTETTTLSGGQHVMGWCSPVGLCDKNLTFSAANPDDKPILDGLGTNSGFKFDSLYNNTLTFSNLVFRNFIRGQLTGAALYF